MNGRLSFTSGVRNINEWFYLQFEYDGIYAIILHDAKPIYVYSEEINTIWGRCGLELAAVE